MARKYRDFFTQSENVSLFPVDLAIPEQAVYLRAQHALKTPDAIQLGTAIACGADYILTNDKAWQRLTKQKVFLANEV